MVQALEHLHIVICCGDYGSDLWPITRQQSPACLAAIEAGSSESLLHACIERMRGYSEYPVHIVTTLELSSVIHDSLVMEDETEGTDFDMMILPIDRGTAFSVALASACIREKDPNAIIMVVPGDQHVELDDRWSQLMLRTYNAALLDKVILVGANQAEKAAHYDYIRRGRALIEKDDLYEVRIFSCDVKPSTAKRMCSQGGYWHAGIIVGRAAVLLGELARCEGKVDTQDGQGAHRIAEVAKFLALLKPEHLLSKDALEVIETLPVMRFETAALMDSTNLAVMTNTIRFSTFNTLDDLEALDEPDSSLNRAINAGTFLDSKKTTVYSSQKNRQIVTLGTNNLLVVDTPDALLIAQRESFNDADRAHHLLQSAITNETDRPARRPFSWGSATVIEQDATHAVWRIELCRGESFDAPFLPYAFELFNTSDEIVEQYTVLKGSVTVGGKSSNAAKGKRMKGEAFFIAPRSALHIECTGPTGAVLLLTAVRIDER